MRMTEQDLMHITSSYPNLDTITILVDEENLLKADKKKKPLTYPPEVDGQLALTGLSRSQMSYAFKCKDVLRHCGMVKLSDPQRNWPVLKVRYERQFIEDKGLDMPDVRRDGR